MERISFQGRNLATARRIWEKMLGGDCTIFLGHGRRAQRRRPAPGRRPSHRQRATSTASSRPAPTSTTICTKRAAATTISARRTRTTRALQAERIDRVYDTYASEEEFCRQRRLDRRLRADARAPALHSREFLYRLGEHLWKETGQDGILTAAYRANVPIFCPAIADSSIGMGLSQARHRDPGAGHIDVIGDIIESANIVIRRPRTASVVLGGGTPKNFINQASVQAEFYDDRVGGHRYALQIVTDVPHFGGASGSSLEEAQSWGKLATDAEQVTVHADATIALPLLASALAASAARRCSRRRKPLRFDLSGPTMTVDGRPLSAGALRGTLT